MACQGKEEFPLPSILREALTDYVNTPVIFKNQTKSWSGVPWTVADMAEKYGNVLLDFRLVPKTYDGISWEGKALFVEATISQFVSWQQGQNVELKSPLNKFSNCEYWAYSSYNHMNKTFSEDSNILKILNWEAFGFPEVTGKESTFWLGSGGSYTPCHMDSYGCNLHAQIIGRKKWVLFPPEDTTFMYPTRIPFEESSVFSSVNILNPDLCLHPKFKNSHPYVVILEPGDVLFVPKKWWHFVLNLDDVTTSINTWIKLYSDYESRLEEGVVRSLMSCFITSLEPVGETWLNPKEEFVPPDESFADITSSLNKLNKQKTDYDAGKNSDCSKVCKTVEGTDVHSMSRNIHQILHCKDVVAVKSVPFPEWIASTCETSICDSSIQEITLNKIVNCFVHPDVVALVCRLLRDN